MTEPPRLAPDRPFPPYDYVPGSGTPHPRTHPAGYAYGTAERVPPPLDPDRWEDSEDYRYAIDLFNHGYYWAAHEVLEGLWIAAGKTGPTALFLKGLIKLCAAGVKARQGMSGGVTKHRRNARRHFAELREATGADRWAGLDVTVLDRVADALVVRTAPLALWPKDDR